MSSASSVATKSATCRSVQSSDVHLPARFRDPPGWISGRRGGGRWNVLGRPARATMPKKRSPGSQGSTSARTAISLSMSMPVSKPSDSRRNTQSSVSILPVAPGANGQPPRPASEASKRSTPASTAAETLAMPRPRVSWKCAASGRPPVTLATAVNSRRTCAGIAVADRVGESRPRRRRPPPGPRRSRSPASPARALDGAAERGRDAAADHHLALQAAGCRARR